MKNSQYVNQLNVNVGEVARLTFNEVQSEGAEIIPVITLSMHVEFLKVVYSTIGDTLNKYADSIANMQSNKGVN
jgi:hypothetical protein